MDQIMLPAAATERHGFIQTIHCSALGNFIMPTLTHNGLMFPSVRPQAVKLIHTWLTLWSRFSDALLLNTVIVPDSIPAWFICVTEVQLMVMHSFSSFLLILFVVNWYAVDLTNLSRTSVTVVQHVSGLEPNFNCYLYPISIIKHHYLALICPHMKCLLYFCTPLAC